MGFLGSSAGIESACNARDPGSIPGLGRSPGEGNGNALQYYCLENFTDTGAWWGHKRVRHDLVTHQTPLDALDVGMNDDAYLSVPHSCRSLY